MGMNYYKKLRLTERQKAELIDAIKQDRLIAAEWESYQPGEYGDYRCHITEADTRPHIGKSSWGWQFLFDHNDWRHFAKDEQAVRAWINDKSIGAIVNEEREEVDPAEIWELHEQKKDLLNGERHHAEQLASGEISPFYPYEPYDFYLGDLRFSILTDFS